MTRIIIRTGGVCIYYHDDSVISVLSGVMRDLTEVQFTKNPRTRQVEKQIKAKFFIHNEKHKMILFHSSQKDTVLDALKSHHDYLNFKVVTQTVPIGKSIEINYTASHKMPRKRQPEYIEFMTDTRFHIRILPASPGAGKTLCTIYGMTVLKVKTAIALQPSLKDNWVDNLLELTDLTEDDILYVSGGDDLYDYMLHVKNRTDNWKVVIFSINTLQGYLTKYLDDDSWIYTPDELFDEAGFGLKVVDEAHKWLHFHSLLDMYSNIRMHHFLTGTLMNESPFLSNMEDTLYPHEDRCPVDPPTNHLSLRAYQYRFNDKPPPHKGMMGYNHMKLEGGIFKKKRLCDAYLRMIASIFYIDYYKTFKKGERALVFFSTTNMVNAFAELLGKTLSDIKVVTYLAGDGEEKYADADVIISTTKKSGTGTDIDGLTYVLQTIMISSKGENYQNALRLRDRVDGNTTFSYIWCGNIPKNVDYHKKRFKDLKPLANSMENRTLSKAI